MTTYRRVLLSVSIAAAAPAAFAQAVDTAPAARIAQADPAGRPAAPGAADAAGPGGTGTGIGTSPGAAQAPAPGAASGMPQGAADPAAGAGMQGSQPDTRGMHRDMYRGMPPHGSSGPGRPSGGGGSSGGGSGSGEGMQRQQGHHHHDHSHHHGGPRGAAMMRGLDTDRDGAVSRAEMDAAHQRIMRAFERADTDRDGKVTQQEMRAYRQAMRTERGTSGGDSGRGAPGAGGAARPGGSGPGIGESGAYGPQSGR